MPNWISDLDASAWIALGAALVALATLPYIRSAANSARREASAGEEQTKLQRKIHEDSAQPYVWASIVPDKKQGTLLNLVVSNEGPTVATDIKVVFDPAPTPTRDPEGFAAVLSKLESGLSSLPPGHRLEWLFDTGFAFLETDADPIMRVTVDCEGPYGPCPTNTYVAQISDVDNSQDWPEGTLHLIEERLKELTKVFKDRDQRQRMAELAAKRAAAMRDQDDGNSEASPAA